MHGRFYNGNRIECRYFDGHNYAAECESAIRSKEGQVLHGDAPSTNKSEDEDVRMKSFGDWLEQQDSSSEDEADGGL